MSKTDNPGNVSEKRLYPRKELRTKIVFDDELGEGFIYFYSTDISMGGLFIESEIPLRIGTKIFLSFKLSEGGKKIGATGEVVRLEKAKGSSFVITGMGVRFLGLSDETKTAIESYISAAR